MGIRGKFRREKKTEQVRLSELYHTQLDEHSSQGGALGFLRQAAFRGIKDDIEKVCIITGNKQINQVNEIVYELVIFHPEVKEINCILDAVEKVPNCKVALYFDSRYSSQTVYSESGYPYITYKPYRATMHASEDEENWWYGTIDPSIVHLGWDELDYMNEQVKTQIHYFDKEEKNYRFLSRLHIRVKNEEDWQAFSDLDKNECKLPNYMSHQISGTDYVLTCDLNGDEIKELLWECDMVIACNDLIAVAYADTICLDSDIFKWIMITTGNEVEEVHCEELWDIELGDIPIIKTDINNLNECILDYMQYGDFGCDEDIEKLKELNVPISNWLENPLT